MAGFDNGRLGYHAVCLASLRPLADGAWYARWWVAVQVLQQRHAGARIFDQNGIIAESPPVSGLYFYDPTGVTSEPLFKALMRQLGLAPIIKEDGLREFQRAGWVLVDATYDPVNALKGACRDRVIARDYQQLHDDLVNLLPDHSIPLVLIKANVCRILEPKLTADGFNVLNGRRVIYFPSSGRQKDFARQFGAVLKSSKQVAHQRTNRS